MAVTLYEIDQRFPDDHCRQIEAEYYIRQISTTDRVHFLDLGAGDGRSFDLANAKIPNLTWVGVDIDSSPEVKSRTRTDCKFLSYDGVNIPFEDATFDVVYSRQVFEHVRHPELLLRDITRVLKPGGFFVGSVSQLEPLHSFSLWNFTYYGFATIAADAGLQLVEMRPGIDGLALCTRHVVLFGLKSALAAIFAPMFSSESPLNSFFESIGKARAADARSLNQLKATYCGHLCFKFRRPD